MAESSRVRGLRLRARWFRHSELLSFLQQGRQRGKWWQSCPVLPPSAPAPSVWLPPGSLPGFPSGPSGAEARGRPSAAVVIPSAPPHPGLQRGLVPWRLPVFCHCPLASRVLGLPQLGQQSPSSVGPPVLRDPLIFFSVLWMVETLSSHQHFMPSASKPSPLAEVPKGLPASLWMTQVSF